MKVGSEMNHGFAPLGGTLEAALGKAKAAGAQGVLFKNPSFVSKTLDKGELLDARAMAEDMGLYLSCGLGKINPFNTIDSLDIWLLGGGSYKRACERMVEANAILGCHHLVSMLGGYRRVLPAPYSFDRFREDVDWEDQLAMAAKFIRKLAPVLRAYGSTVCVETHEEVTSFEVLRLIEEIGPDVVSATLDTANVTARGDDPVSAARRLAPHIRHVHAKDVLLLKTPTGYTRLVRPAGKGSVDFAGVIDVVYAANPSCQLHVEDHMGSMAIDCHDDFWRSRHPDLREDSLAVLEEMSRLSAEKIASGETEAPEEYEKLPFEEICDGRMAQALRHLLGLVEKKEGKAEVAL